jgi:hypothetical protein
MLPKVDDELDAILWSTKDDSLHEPRQHLPSQPILLSTTFVETVSLMQIGETIMNNLYVLPSQGILTRTQIRCKD